MVWNEGYVSEISYTYGYYGELSPIKLALAIALKSFQPINVTQSFTYCELGCGRGYSTNLLAATYPQSQFYANDFNPNQIVEAKSLAKAAGTSNVHFFDDSFEEFIDRDFPKFDFICLHGIYSWINLKNRQEILTFIKRNLQIGGLVYISYNALPGWAVAMPMRALMIRQVERLPGPIVTRIEQALNFTGELLEGNAGYFAQNPILKSRYEKLRDQNRHYLAHEYFNQEWNSFYFDEVAKELEAAKLNYVGSAHFLDHVDLINLSAAAQVQLAQISDPIFREVVRDFFLNTQFRRDIFVRGQLPLTPQEQVQYLQNTRFALMVAPGNIKFEHQFPLGEVKLQEDVYGPICSALGAGGLTLGELQSHPQTQHIPLNSLYQALIILTGIGYVHPAVNEAIRKQRQKSTDAFNAAVMAKALYSDEMNYLASPLIGTGVAVNRLEQLLLLAKSRKQEGVDFVWQVLSSQGKKLVQDGKTLETEEENRTYLQTAAKEFYRERLPLLTGLGIS